MYIGLFIFVSPPIFVKFKVLCQIQMKSLKKKIGMGQTMNESVRIKLVTVTVTVLFSIILIFQAKGSCGIFRPQYLFSIQFS